MFELAPVSLWLEDYSGLNTLFASWRAQGVRDLAAFLAEDTARIMQCAARIRILKVNARTLQLFEADGLDDLLGNLDRIFGPESADAHASELVQLWDGKTSFASSDGELHPERPSARR